MLILGNTLKILAPKRFSLKKLSYKSDEITCLKQIFDQINGKNWRENNF